ncbi:SDR family NAD(P)-dependent oxidoreductase [Kordiimonas lacus]|uniref:NAD(P)-dependent dehydrogenase, short-chain alcohol dehydrogenase family n=1 Tax=Kordiimonas lacus TaxID=637679 RepID=A0A1G6W8T0_9PROT|nr:SDR family NAD(P)-dependent oxidoreductase [Kordiimonas lacus]SDD61465.1 NAD(P)-dependent dehydrogenase, short-chain alcohol dehydrogenase family [Kordiimonas lacus]
MTKPLDGRLALITGASRGIGRAVAIAMAEAGADIIALARPRSQGALEELDDKIKEIGGKCTLVPIDLRDFDAIDRLGASIYERWGKLDILVGNAGILGPISPLGHITPKDWAELMDINVTANWRLIRSLDPLLKLSKTGRAVFVTSGAAGGHYAHWGGYAVTKAALEELVMTYAAESRITGVKVNMVNPGPIRTSMRAKAVPGEDPETLPKPEQIAPLFVELASPESDTHAERINFYDWAGIERS